MRARTVLVSIAALLVLGGSAPGLEVAMASPAGVTVTVTTLHFRVVVGPHGEQTCDIVGDLYRPSTATKAHPAPAILTTNGFGGSKDDQEFLGQSAGERGYVVLSYSGLGFGGSGCKITLDDPDWDGKAASQLIGFLGGAPGVGFTDAAHGHAVAPIDYVLRDATGNDGRHHANDPRVGMAGGSYGGQIQFAAAANDPRLDTIVPMITWNDLSYAITPNNTDLIRGVTSATAGVPKFEWATLFFGDGMLAGLQHFQDDPSRMKGCPNFTNQVCKSFLMSAALGYPTPKTNQLLRHASVASYMSKIRIPTLLIQGEADTLFDLQESIATYRALRVPVKLIWQSWGHSFADPQPGEFAQDETVFQTYEGQRVQAWFDHYLKGSSVGTGPAFAYFRDWVRYEGSGPDDEQYASASLYPVGRPMTMYLSGSNALVSAKSAVRAGVARYTSLPAGAPSEYSETSGAQSELPDGVPPPTDIPGTYVAYSSPRLSRNVDVVGVPTVTLHLSSPSVSRTQSLGPTGMLVMFAKIYDVAPDGSVDLVHRLVSPVRVGDITKPIRVELPGIVHRFAAGHQIRLVLAASDAAYKTSYWMQPVSVLTSPTEPGVLTLPVVG